MWQPQIDKGVWWQDVLSMRLLTTVVLGIGWFVVGSMPGSVAGPLVDRLALVAAVAMAGWLSAYRLQARRAVPGLAEPAGEDLHRAAMLVTGLPLVALSALILFGFGAVPEVVAASLFLIALEQLD